MLKYNNNSEIVRVLVADSFVSKVYVLPDGYEVKNSSLDDIKVKCNK
jgi:hypothetical protein